VLCILLAFAVIESFGGNRTTIHIYIVAYVSKTTNFNLIGADILAATLLHAVTMSVFRCRFCNANRLVFEQLYFLVV
jgi:hypothetical protein